MGAYKFDGVDDIALSVGVDITSYPLTIGVVFMADTSVATGILAGIFDSAADDSYQELQYVSADDVLYRAANAGSGNAATSAGAGADDVWQTATGVGISGTSRNVFRNGANKASTVTSRSFNASIDRVAVGRMGSLTPAEPFHGWVAYVFIWNVALSDAEVANFHAGTLPQQAAIVHSYDFTTSQGSTITDLIGNKDLTVTGAVYDAGVTPSPSFDLGGAPAPDDKFFPFI